MPISDCEVRDPRVRRTRQLLHQALSQLMQSRSFDEISVHDIAEAGAVNRATFYDHYADKYALLEAMVAGGFHKMLNDRNVTFDHPRPKAVGAIVLATCDFLTQSHAGADCQRQSAFEPLMDAAIVHAIARLLIEGLPDEPAAPLPRSVIAAAASWAIYGAVKQWFSTSNHSAAKKMVQPVVDLVMPMLLANVRRDPSINPRL